MAFVTMLYVILLYLSMLMCDDTTLYSKYDQASDLWQEL